MAEAEPTASPSRSDKMVRSSIMEAKRHRRESSMRRLVLAGAAAAIAAASTAGCTVVSSTLPSTPRVSSSKGSGIVHAELNPATGAWLYPVTVGSKPAPMFPTPNVGMSTQSSRHIPAGADVIVLCEAYALKGEPNTTNLYSIIRGPWKITYVPVSYFMPVAAFAPAMASCTSS
jgi:hypothetical protein